jgi:Fur family ferric uptake transcriptional regulator
MPTPSPSPAPALADAAVPSPSASRSAHVLPNLPRVSARRESLPFEPVCAMFRRYLHEQKKKFTPERAMMLDAVLRNDRLFEPEQLVADLKGLGHRVSRATVYRTLAQLQDAGIVKQVFFDNKQSYYEVIVGRETSDYLICAATGRVVAFRSEALQQLRDEICRAHGYQPLSHQFHIFGLSPAAQPAAPPASPVARDAISTAT